jgi:hypothetical protein
MDLVRARRWTSRRIRTFVVPSGTERYPQAEGVEAIGHVAIAQELAQSLHR